MKKILLSIFTLLTATTLFAVDGLEITVAGGDGTDFSSGNGVHTIAVNNADEVILDFHVENNTGASKELYITRVNLDNPSGWTNLLCWGAEGEAGTCYPSKPDDTWTTPLSAIVADGAAGVLVVHVTPNDPTYGTGMYRYYIVENGNNIDSVDLHIAKTVSIKTLSNAPSFNMGPNPATEQVNININGLTNAEVKMVDVLGNVVYKEEVNNSKSINVADFRNGIYFVIISAEGVKPTSKKLIVKH